MTFEFDRFPALDSFPRAGLGHGPTPLVPAPRLGEALGLPHLMLKRDDVHPLGAGGNKLRKLDFHLGAALASGADTVITFGALQTNHGRQTAAACARLGLRCELVLTARVPRSGAAYEESGNIPLDLLFGARVHTCADESETASTYEALVEEAAAEGRKVVTIPVGGSDPLGVLGYVSATHELAVQLSHLGVERARIVGPHASGATAAGLALGSAVLGSLDVDIACVSHPLDEAEENLAELVTGAAQLLGIDPPTLEHVWMNDSTIGEGYGIPAAETWGALRLFGRTEGVVLDPVYTGKVAAALVEWAAEGRFSPEETVVFVHTGGLPGLYGYAPEFTAAMRE
ncbi:D-cysteine desulfhydrase family protein [Amycolatopsis jiangsuensis]|uniref:D-cysteine desulfhydrase n=1 Tax=Amycolatopsis jiangsuensis TaxID=1181879 RepID=A0A840IVB2_9PSEU|nr:D-cysteine desulfhydrase family protein [Amycolatopsis jiangsuensis]MBB4686671.1 D-cysteine desulfhydrase [Amycolatopsis jiangsuensis]